MRLRPALHILFALFLAGPLPACGLFGGGDEEPTIEAQAAEAERRAEPVQALQRVEIGRTRTGYVITAFGTAPGTGWGGATLRARRDGRPGTDGFLDFDFVAVPPDPEFGLPQGTISARAIRADAQVTERQLRGVQGFRVHTLTNAGQVVLGAAPDAS